MRSASDLQSLGLLAQLLLGAGDALARLDRMLLDLAEPLLRRLQGLCLRFLLEGQLGIEGLKLGGEAGLGGLAGRLDLLARAGLGLAAVSVELLARPLLGAADLLAGVRGGLLGFLLLALELLLEREDLGRGRLLGLAARRLRRVASPLLCVLNVHG